MCVLGITQRTSIISFGYEQLGISKVGKPSKMMMIGRVQHSVTPQILGWLGFRSQISPSEKINTMLFQRLKKKLTMAYSRLNRHPLLPILGITLITKQFHPVSTGPRRWTQYGFCQSWLVFLFLDTWFLFAKIFTSNSCCGCVKSDLCSVYTVHGWWQKQIKARSSCNIFPSITLSKES